MRNESSNDSASKRVWNSVMQRNLILTSKTCFFPTLNTEMKLGALPFKYHFNYIPYQTSFCDDINCDFDFINNNQNQNVGKVLICEHAYHY